MNISKIFLENPFTPHAERHIGNIMINGPYRTQGNKPLSTPTIRQGIARPYNPIQATERLVALLEARLQNEERERKLTDGLVYRASGNQRMSTGTRYNLLTKYEHLEKLLGQEAEELRKQKKLDLAQQIESERVNVIRKFLSLLESGIEDEKDTRGVISEGPGFCGGD